MSKWRSSKGRPSPDVWQKVNPGWASSRCDASSMLVAVIRSGHGYHFSKKLESAADWSGVTPTSRIEVNSVGAITSMKAR